MSGMNGIDGMSEKNELQLGAENLKDFYLMEVLLSQTDKDHHLNAAELIGILERDYQITVNRGTIYKQIKRLTDAGLNIETKSGYYISQREFQLAELKLLVDAVQFSNFITKEDSERLIRKLETLCSKHEAKQLQSQVTIYNRPKTSNSTVFTNVDRIHSAIFHNHQITYQYVEWGMKKELKVRHGGEYYIVSPLHLIWDDEYYYLIGYDEKTQGVRHYRVDKMRDLQVQEETIRSKKALEQVIDVAAFSGKTFGMFSGEDVEVRFRGKKHLAGVLLDRFGTNIWMRPLDEEHFSAHVTVALSPQFFGWVTAIGKDLQIVGPESVKEQYRSYLEDILKGLDES